MDSPVNQTTGNKVDSPWRRGVTLLERCLIPPHCLICDERGSHHRDLCEACHAALHWNRSACRQCGLPLAIPALACGRCLASAPAYARTEAPLVYGFPVDALVARFKFHGDLAAGRVLAELFLHGLPDRPATAWPQALVPVPLHVGRLRQRGYDQALELAKALGISLGVTVLADGLRRQRATGAQSELGAGARRRNVRAAFMRGAGLLPDHVALIDDVMTTGATLGECARTLQRAGVTTVELWVVARAPHRG